MLKLMGMRALIFDFDGTILDTETPEFLSWEKIYHQHDQILPRNLWLSAIGVGPQDAKFNPYTHLEELVGTSLDHEKLRAQRHKIFYRTLDDEPIRPGVTDWLEQASTNGLHIGLASSSPYDWVHGHLERLGLRSHFSAIYTSDHVERAKPHPELYEKTAAHFGVKPSACIAIEDSFNGVTAAKAAGCYCIATPNPMTVTMDLSAADRIVLSLEEIRLAELLEG
ncbi:HAD family hydrolase [Armatimonas sp.]|uniref:HAD family hydrolase n=1 Tax=Armatimonas sp. TaxID=1872638 RepID=UPI00286A6765|nr:HAD family hydrolase [Armatimonas sp.]